MDIDTWVVLACMVGAVIVSVLLAVGEYRDWETDRKSVV